MKGRRTTSAKTARELAESVAVMTSLLRTYKERSRPAWLERRAARRDEKIAAARAEYAEAEEVAAESVYDALDAERRLRQLRAETNARAHRPKVDRLRRLAAEVKRLEARAE